ncbi:GIY-YIG nuclease family protein [Streptomyces sp. NBC_00989]|uniref:GIY-YIG nuclease family protein n=1 Tax=Streptomyces sp. NBC_00989 TaxID=2903705 RepID=UPI00386DD06A|nr:GIY-YIG nuclease family protein [Streptomyces sp. NBC_00989]
MTTDQQGPTEVVYLMGAESLDLVKIGTTTDVNRRVRTMQTGLPLTLSVLWTCEGNRELEQALHKEFREHNRRGEWFDLTSLGDPVAVVSTAVRRLAPGLGLPIPPPRVSPDVALALVAPTIPGCVRLERILTARMLAWFECEDFGLPPTVSMPVMVYQTIQYDAEDEVLAVTHTLVTKGHQQPEGFVYPEPRGGN